METKRDVIPRTRSLKLLVADQLRRQGDTTRKPGRFARISTWEARRVSELYRGRS